ncbi:hypothetical protein DDR33_24210 [Pararcticibacter amylolyticus]|uniref:Uncharacterized protein n=1 Tax=Pararcticibacter amylolyticus TaxID=2173175 RepID=A0A2U2PAC2_9SPHI|nr:hypothetical protein DDR33_24210 [Pararcticibacter amylolyticus]
MLFVSALLGECRNRGHYSCDQSIIDRIIHDDSKSSCYIVIFVDDQSDIFPVVIQYDKLLNYYRWFEKKDHLSGKREVKRAIESSRPIKLNSLSMAQITADMKINPKENKYSDEDMHSLLKKFNDNQIKKMSVRDRNYLIYTLITKYCKFLYQEDETGAFRFFN